MPRIDRFLSAKININRKDVRLMLAQRRVQVDGVHVNDVGHVVNSFSVVCLDGEILQERAAHYLMLNKPPGVVSATADSKHQTVIDLLSHPDKDQLHLVGRLDFNSTGLVLLTNDGAWSRRLAKPEHQMKKHYRVTVEKSITQEYVDAFEQGMYFEYENITTRPAELTIVGDYEAKVSLVEGRYHQIKRMFGRFDNKVLSLDRYAIGSLMLDSNLKRGESRSLTTAELDSLE